MGAGAGVGVGDGMGGICLPIYPRRYIVPKGPLRASTFFWRGSFFLLGSRGGTCSSSSRRKSVLVLFISVFFLEGAFLVLLLLLLGSTWLSLSLSLSFFLSRSGEFGRGKRVWKRERKERKAV